VSVAVGIPGISIGINVPVYPELVPVPGYPVYYAPGADSNYFFYDGLYWVYARDAWYASAWYDGPWRLVRPERVPLYVLRVPVRYYRQPPPYFRGWRAEEPPRWGQHWGRGWEQRRPGWNRWNRSAVPAPAPLPVYQRQYAGDRYPRAPEQQHAIRSEHYRHDPRESVTRQQFRPPRPPPASRQPEPRHMQADPRRGPAEPAQRPQGYRGRPQDAAPQAPGRQPEPRRMQPDPRRGPAGTAQPTQRPSGNRGSPQEGAPQERGREKRGEDRGEGRR
jgi:hypothetical protein